MHEAREQLRGCVDGRVDAEGGALVGGPGKEVDKRVPCIVPQLGYLSILLAHSLPLFCPATATYLLAVQQERQVVWHLALVSDNPSERAGSGRCIPWPAAAIVSDVWWPSAKQAALPAQLL